MTVTSLRKQAFHLMKTNKDGTYKERQRRAFILDKIIHGLYAGKLTPATWQHVETEHIHVLVKLWKEQRIKASTIMRYMTIIRKVLAELNCHVGYIDNKSLQLSRPKSRKKRIKMSADLWQAINNRAVRIIMALQTHFGLTFKEAIHMKTSVNVQDHQLSIFSDNSLERVIPICTDQQQAIINEFNLLLDRTMSLHEKFGHHYLRLFWRNELKRHQLPSNKSWRYWYAKQRFDHLLPEIGHYKTCLRIKDEMSIKSRNTLRLYLQEK